MRLENSRNEPGAGLGLSLVAAVAEAHGGRLELDEGPGKVGETGPGLRVALVLPARGLDPGVTRGRLAGQLRALRAGGRRQGGGAGARDRRPRPAGAPALEARGRRWRRCSGPRPIWPAWRGATRDGCARCWTTIRTRGWRTSWRATAAAAEPRPTEAPRRRLRRLKAELHLLTALADLGGVWDLDQVTGALTRFADAAVAAALAVAARGGAGARAG